MNAKAQDEAPYISNGVLAVIKLLNGSRVEGDGDATVLYEPEYRELFYDNDRSLVVIAVDRDRLPPIMTAEFFNRQKNQAVFRGFLGKQVKAFEADGVLYFRVEVPSVTEAGSRRNGHAANIQSLHRTRSRPLAVESSDSNRTIPT